MAYSKNTWATGDVITAEKLNSIENAVGNVSSSVDSMAPTVAKIDNIENSIGNINSEINNMAPTLAKVNPLESAVQSLSSEIASARNYNSAGTANTLGGRIDELVRISNTQPGGNNEIWVNSGNGVVETEVPTYQEFNNLIVNQNTQPSAASNRIWIPTSGGEEVEVPDMGEFNELKNSNAPEYSNNAIYAVGEYVFHNGNLYRCTTAITTAETWTATHWTQVVFGSELRDFKSTLKATGSLIGFKWYNGYYEQSSGSFVTTEYWKMSGAIPCAPGDTFTYCGASSQQNRAVIVFFDKNKAQLERRANLGTDYVEVTVVVPNNAEYFRVLGYTDRINDTYIIYGVNANQNPMFQNKMRIISLESALDSASDEILAEKNARESADNVLTKALNSTSSLIGLKWYNGYYNQSDGSFVTTEYWKMSNSIPCTSGDTFTYCGASSQQNRTVIIFFNKDGAQLERRANLGTDYTEVAVVVPNGAEYFRVLGYPSRINDTYIVYGINASQNPTFQNRKRIMQVETSISALEISVSALEKSNETVYVDGNATAGGDGSMSHPFQTIMEAVQAGYRIVKAKSGVYEANQLRIEDDRFELSLWSNLNAFNVSVPNREKIVFFKGDILTPTLSNNLLTSAYTPRDQSRFKQVFVNKTLSPIDSSFEYATAYFVNLFLWKPGHKSRRYEPVLYENFTGVAGTFTYNNGNVIVSPYETDNDAGLRIYVSADPAIPMYFSNVCELHISDVVVMGGYYGGLQLHGCQNSKIQDCEFICTGHGDGIEAFDSNVTIVNCVASGCVQDGYGFQFYGNSEILNCSAFYCGDDGVSHHRGCTGVIDGGEWGYCVGGITPAFGAKIDIKNVYIHNNNRGLQYLGSNEYARRNVYAIGCVSVDNTTDVFADKLYDVVLGNSVYGTKSIGASATLTEYGNTILS